MKKWKSYEVFVVFKDKKIRANRRGKEGKFEYRFNGIPDIPNIPFYAYLFEDGFHAKYNNEMKATKGWKEVKRKNIVILCEDDCMGTDKRLLSEFTKLTLKGKDIKLIYKYNIIGEGYDEYVSVSRSCRLTIITYCQGADVYQSFIENRDMTVEDMQREIRGVHKNIVKRDIPVLLNGENLKEFKPLGRIIRDDEIFKMAENIDIEGLEEEKIIRL